MSWVSHEVRTLFPPRRPAHFRGVQVASEYRYAPLPGQGDDARRGESCTVLVVPSVHARGPRNVLVVFTDGHRAVVPWSCLRPLQRGTR